MKEYFKLGVGAFGRLLIVGIMCFFVCISMSVLCTAAFTENIGYTAYGYKEGDEQKTELYKYYNKDGEDTQKEKYEAEGYTVETVNFRSDLSKKGNTVFLFVSQVVCTLMVIAFIYPGLWQAGTKDSNAVRFKHKKEDKLKGFKVGLIACAPSFLLVIAFAVCGLGAFKELPCSLFRFLNCYNYSFVELTINGVKYAGELAPYKYVLLFAYQLIPVAVAFVAYLLGYKDISLSEKFIYKKNKK